MMAAGLTTPVSAPNLSPLIFDGESSSSSQEVNSQKGNLKPLTPINEMPMKTLNISNVEQNSQQQQQQTIKKKNNKEICKPKKPNPVPIDPAKLCSRDNIYATPFYRQLSILLIRTFLILWRDKSLTTMRFVIHFITALLIGFLYYGIGNDAGNALNNFRYIFYTIMFIMYCAFSSILINCK